MLRCWSQAPAYFPPFCNLVLTHVLGKTLPCNTAYLMCQHCADPKSFHSVFLRAEAGPTRLPGVDAVGLGCYITATSNSSTLEMQS
eukprot:1161296-Pelagomonas_calceolata.AAC.2